MTSTGARSIRALFRRREDPYAGADLGTSRKIVGLLWALCSVLTLALLPLSPPTDALGTAGWAAALLTVAGGFVGVRLLLDERRAVTFDGLLAVSYLGLVQTALLVFLAGEHSGYRELFVLWVGSGVGVHPPRRGLRFLAAALVASSLPLIYEGYSAHAAGDIAAHALRARVPARDLRGRSRLRAGPPVRTLVRRGNADSRRGTGARRAALSRGPASA